SFATWGPDLAPTPQTFVAPRPSRGAPLLLVRYMGAPIWLPPPRRSSRPGQAVALLCLPLAPCGPRFGSRRPALRAAPATPGRSSNQHLEIRGVGSRVVCVVALLVVLAGCRTFTAPEPARLAPLLPRLGDLLLVGFHGTTAEGDAGLERLLCETRAGGALLFGRNVVGAEQLARLTHALAARARECAGRPPRVAVD